MLRATWRSATTRALRTFKRRLKIDRHAILESALRLVVNMPLLK